MLVWQLYMPIRCSMQLEARVDFAQSALAEGAPLQPSQHYCRIINTARLLVPMMQGTIISKRAGDFMRNLLEAH